MTFTIYLTNTLTKKKEEFVPLDESNVRMYNCGVTPYDYAHIGNARNAVAFDTLFRLMRWRYGADKVTYARNFTDIDDKIIVRAQEKGTTPDAIASEFMQAYTEDVTALGCMTPSVQPLVTEEIPEIIEMTERLIENGHAYVTPSGDVNYDISTKADYGKLSRQKLEDLMANSRVEIDSEEKRNSGDFALWKAAKEGEVYWDSPWGKGRPGWHIECSAMSAKYLGKHFDIHSGGEDLQFPHHENEIAQSEGAFGQKSVNYWLHNAFITVAGQRMGKSVGNFTTIRDALEMVDGRAIRMWLLQTHYRKPVDFTPEALKASQKRLNKLLRALENAPEGAIEGGNLLKDVQEKMAAALGDDMNTSKGLALLDTLRSQASEDADVAATLRWGMGLLGLTD